MDALLSFADGTQHKPPYLVAPPLKAHHEQARDGQLYEGPPVHHTLPAPPSPSLPVETTRPHVEEHEYRGNPLTDRHGSNGSTAEE